MDDPDAVKVAGKVWDHWLVWNIPPETTEIIEGKEPTGIHGKGTSGNLKYSGPCPPGGEHHYFFRIYALDSLLALEEGATKSEVLTAIQGKVIAQTELMGKYARKPSS